MLVRDAHIHEMPSVGDLRVTTYVGQGLLAGDSDYVPTLHAIGASGDGTVLVAVDGDEIVGTATLMPFRESSEIALSAEETEIRALAVAPAAQGRGVGRLLLRAVVDRAARDGARHLVLSTQPDMVAAQRMYASEGFARLPERDWSPVPGLGLLCFGLRLS
ncbi:GNAT family N-acetyltransferase [Actinorugispora endophytica]|nr:GNAT family N-acetyltransferase [Actinorugispora endophytica]